MSEPDSDKPDDPDASADVGGEEESHIPSAGEWDAPRPPQPVEYSQKERKKGWRYEIKMLKISHVSLAFVMLVWSIMVNSRISSLEDAEYDEMRSLRERLRDLEQAEVTKFDTPRRPALEEQWTEQVVKLMGREPRANERIIVRELTEVLSYSKLKVTADARGEMELHFTSSIPLEGDRSQPQPDLKVETFVLAVGYNTAVPRDLSPMAYSYIDSIENDAVKTRIIVKNRQFLDSGKIAWVIADQ